MKYLLPIISVLVCVTSAAADTPNDLRRVFPKQAIIQPVTPGHPPLTRLDLPLDVLRESRADLSDARIIDSRGEEVPFAVNPCEPSSMVDTKSRLRKPLRVLSARRSTVGVTNAPAKVIEIFEVDLTTSDTEVKRELVIETSELEFVRRIDIETLEHGHAKKWLAGGSLFRLPKAQAESTRAALPLGPASHLRITLTGEGTYLQPQLFVEQLSAWEARPHVTVLLDELSKERNNGKTSLLLSRPLGVKPRFLRFETDSQTFDRPVVVNDLRQGANASVVVRGKILRLQGIATVQHLELPISEVTGRELRVEVEDGDSPALQSLRVFAVIDQPSLIFDPPHLASGVFRGTLYFGGGRARAPQYDLSRLLSNLAKRAHDNAANPDFCRNITAAALDPIADNPHFDAKPTLAFAMQSGAQVDESSYAYHRSVRIQPSKDGLSRLLIPATDLRYLRDDMIDMRVIDKQNRQWPFILQVNEREILVPLSPSKAAHEDDKQGSQHTLRVAQLPLRAVSLAFEETYFNRPFELWGKSTADNSLRMIASGRLERRPNDADSAITIVFDPIRLTELQLRVKDGANAPLRLKTAAGVTSSVALYIVAPEGYYRLLLGNSGEHVARYDIESIRKTLLSLASTQVELGPLQKNPHYNPKIAIRTSPLAQRIVLWIALGIAALTLGMLVFRISRNA